MLRHLLNLLVISLINFPSVLSANWLSLLFPLLVYVALYLAKEGKPWRNGWAAMKSHLRRDTTILVAAYVLLYSWSVIKTIYQDHLYFVQKTRLLHLEEERSRKDDEAKRLAIAGQLQALQVQCARTEGANDKLEGQNRDQQSTINSCQTQALHLLEPVPLHIEPVKILVASPAGKAVSQYLLLTNKQISPVLLNIECSENVDQFDIHPAAETSGMIMPRSNYISHRVFEMSFDSPAWTPKLPLIASILFSSQNEGKCSFTTK